MDEFQSVGGLGPIGSGMELMAGSKVIPREQPDVSLERMDLVKDWLKKIEAGETNWKDTFDEMRGSAKFARGKQWAGQQKGDDRYLANITLRHINQRVSSIYAKNPRVQADRMEKIWYQQWDGSKEMMDEAKNAIAQAAMDPQQLMLVMQSGTMQPSTMDPMTAQAVMAEAQDIKNKKALADKMAKTLELVAQYSLDEPNPRFKTQAKQLVRRVLTCSAGFIKLGYQRIMKPSPEVDGKIKDITDRLAHLESLAADLADGEIEQHSKEAEELNLNLAALQQQEEVVQREGLVFSFPKAWAVIIDPNCIQLKGFVGAEWIAEKYLFTERQVKSIYKIDIKNSSYNAYKIDGEKSGKKGDDTYCAVYEVYDLRGQVSFTIIAGYNDFVKEPAEPDVILEQFHPYFALTFNDVEDPDSIYPPSDVELMRPMATEYNRAREGLREHRIANTPGYVIAKGVFDENSKTSLSSHAPMEMIETNLNKSDDIDKAMRAKPTIPIDPALYDTEAVFTDSQRVVGSQAEELGGSSGTSATSVSIAEGSRVNSLQSNIDDLDECLSDVMRSAGQILFREMRQETAKEIAGPGAVWPQLQREEIARELILSVKAGSSGRPNKAGRMAAIEKVAPFLVQVPGLLPKKMAGFMIQEMDENIDIEDWFEDGLPSIVAMNAQARPNLAPQAGNMAQAAMGAMNAPAPAESAAKDQNMNPSGQEIGVGMGQ